MKITISSGAADDARSVTVEQEGEKPVSFKAKNLADAHAQIKQGRKEGWDSLKAAPEPKVSHADHGKATAKPVAKKAH